MNSKLDFLQPEQGFLGLSRQEMRDGGSAEIAVIPFGLEASVSYGGGTQEGPQAILDASHQVELFDEELWCEPCRSMTLATHVPIAPDPSHEKALDRIEQAVRMCLDEHYFPLVLGGEHSLTIGAARPFFQGYADLVILQFDAHADLRDGYEGNRYSHAAAMRRLLDAPGVDLVSLGIRSLSAAEAEFAAAAGERVQLYLARDRKAWDLEKIVSFIGDRPVYLTFDVDVLDPSILPSTGTPEPCGLTYEEALNSLRTLVSRCRIVGADIVELAPIAGMHAPDFTVARLAYKLLSYMFVGKVPEGKAGRI